jgi:hypothetical protein
MRTFLSHDETARKSFAGEKWSAEMLSSGGSFSAMSLEGSPWVAEAGCAAGVLPKRDILSDFEVDIGGREGMQFCAEPTCW